MDKMKLVTELKKEAIKMELVRDYYEEREITSLVNYYNGVVMGIQKVICKILIEKD